MTSNDQGSHAKKRKRKDSGDRDNQAYPEVSLDQLQMNTLRRYKRYYKLQTRQGLNKVQLLEAVNRHFRSMPVNEKETVAFFIYMVKMNRNRVDTKELGSLNSNSNNSNQSDETVNKESKSRAEQKN